jgi:hypothetical protein
MNCDNNYAMLGLNNDGDNLFEAAFSNTLLPDTHNNLTPQTQIVKTEEAIHVMPLTKSEIEAILGARASNAQIYHHTYSLAQPELNNDFSGFEEAGAYYNGAEIPISTNFNDFDMPGYGNASPSTLDGFGTFEQPRFEEPAEVFGALTDCAPDTADQSG